MEIISFFATIVVLIVVLKLLTLPFKIIIKFVINSIIGGIVIAVLSFFGIAITINKWTILLTGFLGVPGVVISLIITMFV